MTEALPGVYLARHGETAWSLSGQHTGPTDLPLTERGERSARALGERTFAKVLTSPLQRAARTCEVAGFGRAAAIDPDLVERDYGQYRGAAPQRSTPSFPTGCCSATAARGEKRRTRSVRGPTASSAGCARSKGDLLVFSDGHFLRVLAPRWLGLRAAAGQHFLLDTASPSRPRATRPAARAT